MKKYLLILLPFFILFVACKGGKKTSLKDDDKVDVADFISFFPDMALPVRLADTSLKKQNDSALIGYRVFTQFVPDSVLSNVFGKGVHPKLYAIGKTAEKGKETYLFFKAVSGSKRAGYMACFDDKQKYLNAMPLVTSGFDTYTSAYGMLDNKFQITTYREKKNGNNKSFKKNVYIYNGGANEFTLIFTEPNEEMTNEVINPIDTLPRKSKFAGDYVQSKNNYVSVRDGKNASEVLFFIHFEKEGDCNGELKGTARFISPTVAQYVQSGNPCVVELSFAGNRVTLKEKGGCGTYRGIKCFFEGGFPKKKEVKPRQAHTKK
ncbi:MAG: hypothetical protein QM731_12385 [Chitinophagaceae bacterium]